VVEKTVFGAAVGIRVLDTKFPRTALGVTVRGTPRDPLR
jgi:hypothetical protein